jgi:hypothetical protein
VTQGELIDGKKTGMSHDTVPLRNPSGQVLKFSRHLIQMATEKILSQITYRAEWRQKIFKNKNSPELKGQSHIKIVK